MTKQPANKGGKPASSKAEKDAAKTAEQMRENAEEHGVHIASPDEVGNPATPPPPQQGEVDPD